MEASGVLVFVLLATCINAEVHRETGKRTLESDDDNTMVGGVDEMSELEREILESSAESKDDMMQEGELFKRLIEDVEDQKETAQEEMTKRAKQKLCRVGVCKTSDCTSRSKKKYLTLACPHGKTPMVVSSIYGFWKSAFAFKDACHKKKGQCTVKANVKEYPCRGQSSCTITLETSRAKRPCSGWLMLDGHDYMEIEYRCTQDIDVASFCLNAGYISLPSRSFCIGLNPCKNGAKCLNIGGNKQCVCEAGFKGRNCERTCPLVGEGGLPEKLDIVFIVDGSGSVTEGSFKQGLNFIRNIVEKMDISPTTGRVGFIQYSSHVQKDHIISLDMSAANGKATLLEEIMRIPYMGGRTRIGPALQEALKMFNKVGRSGEDVTKYIMVLSDGESLYPGELTAAMKKIRAKNIETFSIGVGPGAKKEESRKQLLEIAQGKKQHLFEVENYNELNAEVLKKIMVVQCN